MRELTPEEHRILREKGTEPPFSGSLLATSEAGAYRCKGCDTLLFTSQEKYDSGSGWPSFTNPADVGAVGTRLDASHGMERVEVFCKTCGGHLGHVFDDGPRDADGKRYCINSLSLSFTPEP